MRCSTCLKNYNLNHCWKSLFRLKKFCLCWNFQIRGKIIQQGFKQNQSGFRGFLNHLQNFCLPYGIFGHFFSCNRFRNPDHQFQSFKTCLFVGMILIMQSHGNPFMAEPALDGGGRNSLLFRIIGKSMPEGVEAFYCLFLGTAFYLDSRHDSQRLKIVLDHIVDFGFPVGKVHLRKFWKNIFAVAGSFPLFLQNRIQLREYRYMHIMFGLPGNQGDFPAGKIGRLLYGPVGNAFD